MDYEDIRDSVIIPAIMESGFAITCVPMDSSDGETVTPGVAMEGYAMDLGTYDNLKPGATVREGSRKLMVAGLSDRPRPGDKIVMESTTMRVVDVEVVQPGGVALYYEVYVK